ncbi:MAG: hypothetical protein F6K22_14940 [Okeania sp. SIO2F4]|nr:hypothetical protein [Okeania sp. SIO2F4]
MQLAKQFGYSRFVYKHFLNLYNPIYQQISQKLI